MRVDKTVFRKAFSVCRLISAVVIFLLHCLIYSQNLLRSVKRLIYVDTDTVFLESLAHLWSMFSDFNSTQLAGLVGEAEAGFAAWYNRFASHPFYGKFGECTTNEYLISWFSVFVKVQPNGF